MQEFEKELVEFCPEELIQQRPGEEYRNIQTITYHSSVTDTDRKANVVLPRGYSEDKKYPVLYCLHGFFGNEWTMLREENSFVPEILANMALDGTAKEVIAVFPNIYVTADEGLAPGFSVAAIEPYDTFREELADVLEPYMREHYSVLEGPENRAIIGFSFGGRVATYIAFTRPDLASYVCAVSPAPGLIPARDWAMEHPGLFAKEEFRPQVTEPALKVFLMCRGSKDSVVGKYPVEYHEALTENGVEHVWYEATGLEHGEKMVQSAVHNLMRIWQ